MKIVRHVRDWAQFYGVLGTGYGIWAVVFVTLRILS
jgi:hypothetical protein